LLLSVSALNSYRIVTAKPQPPAPRPFQGPLDRRHPCPLRKAIPPISPNAKARGIHAASTRDVRSPSKYRMHQVNEHRSGVNAARQPEPPANPATALMPLTPDPISAKQRGMHPLFSPCLALALIGSVPLLTQADHTLHSFKKIQLDRFYWS